MADKKQLTIRQMMLLLKGQDPEHEVYARLGNKSFPVGWATQHGTGNAIALDVESDPNFAPTVDGVWNTLEVEVGKTKGRKPLWVTHEGKNYKVTGLKTRLTRVTIQTEEEKTDGK